MASHLGWSRWYSTALIRLGGRMKIIRGRTLQTVVAAGCAVVALGMAAVPAEANTVDVTRVTIPLPLPLPSDDGGEETTPPPLPSEQPTQEPAPVPTEAPGPNPSPVVTPAPNPAPNPEQPSLEVPNPAEMPSAPVPFEPARPAGEIGGQQLQLPILPSGDVVSSEEPVAPASPANETATPSPTSSPSAAAVVTPSPTATAVPLSNQASATMNAVVTAATGSPFYVQALTVLALVGSGIVYFRLMRSKEQRFASKTAK